MATKQTTVATTNKLDPITIRSPLDVENQQANDDNVNKDFNGSKRAQWLRPAVLGANDGLVSTASLMIGVGAVKQDVKAMILTGFAGLVAGACSMAIGEYVSVYSQLDNRDFFFYFQFHLTKFVFYIIELHRQGRYFLFLVQFLKVLFAKCRLNIVDRWRWDTPVADNESDLSINWDDISEVIKRLNDRNDYKAVGLLNFNET